MKYVAIRSDWKDAAAVYPGIKKLNESMSKSLRQAANVHGIKQTAKVNKDKYGYILSQRLEFYSMDDDMLADINTPESEMFATLQGVPHLRPLLSIEESDLILKSDEVNKKYGGGRMMPPAYKIYKLKLKEAMASVMTLMNTEAKPNYKGPEGFTVGDYVKETEWGKLQQVIKVTKKTLTLAYIELDWTVYPKDKRFIKGAKTIAYKNNMDLFKQCTYTVSKIQASHITESNGYFAKHVNIETDLHRL